METRSFESVAVVYPPNRTAFQFNITKSRPLLHPSSPRYRNHGHALLPPPELPRHNSPIFKLPHRNPVVISPLLPPLTSHSHVLPLHGASQSALRHDAAAAADAAAAHAAAADDRNVFPAAQKAGALRTLPPGQCSTVATTFGRWLSHSQLTSN